IFRAPSRAGLSDGVTIHRSKMMKRSQSKPLWTAALVLVLALCSAPLTPVLLGQSQSNAQQDQQKSQTVVGKIVKAANGQYALLTDEQAGKGMFLDNQGKVKKFEGKVARVTGVFDVAKNV